MNRYSFDMMEQRMVADPYGGEWVRHSEAEALRAELAQVKADRDKLIKRFTPKPIRFAPKDRVIIGVERPPQEETTFFYDVIWRDEYQEFMTASWPMARNGASHFLDPENLIGIVWPRERAAILARIEAEQ